MELPPSLWPALHRIATACPWPPSAVEDALKFVEEAKLQFLLPLLCEAPVLPSAVAGALEPFKAFNRLSETHSAILESELRQLIGILADEEITLLKGCDYGHRLYDRPALRPMADIDILVPSSRIGPIAQRLERAGYHRSYHGGSTWKLKSAHEYVFLTERATIELHQSFIQRTRTTIDYEAVWGRRVPMRDFPANVFRLGDVDAITYHALSQAIDEFEARLIRDVDLWLMLRLAPSSLPEVAERAAAWSCRHALFGTLTLAADLFPDLRSAEYERSRTSLLPRSTQRFLVERVLPNVFLRRFSNKPGRLAQLWRKFWLMDSMTRRAAFAGHHVWSVAFSQLTRIARRSERSASTAPSSTGQP